MVARTTQIIRPEALGIDLAALDPATALTMTEVAEQRLVPGRGGRRINAQTLQRWAGTGAPVGPGIRLLLPARKVNGVYLAMRAWVEKFWAEKLRRENAPAGPAPPTARQADRSARRAHAELQKELSRKK